MIFVTVSTGHFDPLIAQCEALKDKYEFFGQIGCSTVKPSFPYIETCTPQELESFMSQAELVVAHAGTGMLSTIHRLKRPCVVIPKQIRYGEANDGQVELARKWGELGLGVLCMDVKELERHIEICRKTRFSFPSFPSLGDHIRKSLGWESSKASAA